MPLTFMTAWHALVQRAKRPARARRCSSTPPAPASGVAAVQIAKLLGARVIATAGSDAKLEKAKALGADHVVNYETQDFVQEVRKLTDKKGVEVVFEHVGKKTWEKSLLAAGDRRPDRHGRARRPGTTR